MAWHVIRWAILLLALAPFAYYLLAIVSALRFFGGRHEVLPTGFAPPVSVLKPVHGLDREAYENYASFCRQHYPEYEILFNVADEFDPAIPMIETIIRDFPEVSIRLLIGAEQLGSFNKVNKLVRMAREAKYDILVVSDSDIRVGSEYLREVVTPFKDSQVGAVTCLYRGLADDSFGSQLEALGNSSDFDAGVLAGWQLQGVNFTLGATMATTKSRLAEIGGFEALVDLFVDDYELGHRIAARGYRIELISYPVETVYPRETLRESFAHQVRWNLAIRNAEPLKGLGLVFVHGLPWALLAAALAPSARLAAIYLGGYVVLRFAMAWTVGVWGLRDPLLRRKIWMLPLRDAFAFLVWLRSLFNHRVQWRGSEYIIRDKRLVPAGPRAARG
ncbi:MAG: bacteriohopanetetrol glucosamine biosynthesis glycosyltransferase HpnI [Candidatus Acidiferrales bacterium]